jgi:CheY-like chemotaxis protein
MPTTLRSARNVRHRTDGSPRRRHSDRMLPPKTHRRSIAPKSRLPSSISRLHGSSLTARVLIVDQDRQLGVTLSFMLASRQFDEVRAVRSTRRAITVAEQFLPDIVFLDIDVPEDGGIPLGRLLIRDSHRRRPRLIALTKHLDHPNVVDIRAAGFERLLVKPIQPEALDSILRISRTVS